MPPNEDECACGCGASLRTAPSDYFATEACQRQWARRQAGQPDLTVDAAMQHLTDIVRDRRRQRESGGTVYMRPVGGTHWQEIGHTSGTLSIDTEYSRWWSYDNVRALWDLRETDGINTRSLHFVSDDMARRTPAGIIEEHLKRRLGGHVPPLPAQYLD